MKKKVESKSYKNYILIAIFAIIIVGAVYFYYNQTGEGQAFGGIDRSTSMCRSQAKIQLTIYTNYIEQLAQISGKDVKTTEVSLGIINIPTTNQIVKMNSKKCNEELNKIQRSTDIVKNHINKINLGEKELCEQISLYLMGDFRYNVPYRLNPIRVRNKPQLPAFMDLTQEEKRKCINLPDLMGDWNVLADQYGVDRSRILEAKTYVSLAIAKEVYACCSIPVSDKPKPAYQ